MRVNLKDEVMKPSSNKHERKKRDKQKHHANKETGRVRKPYKRPKSGREQYGDYDDPSPMEQE